MSKPRLIAFYLPQFYPTKENDEWWQKGFTEWTNVGNAKPLFKGHYQPRVPADLGYYDLRIPEVRVQQAELAKEAGIEGFCYWHYWFSGRRLLDRVFSEVVSSGEPDYPFCLCWANHSWYQKTWDPTKPDRLLIEQEYPGEEDYKNHFYAMLPAFKDKRYMKVGDKLIFGVYDPMAIPDFKRFEEIWNNLAQENGLSGFYFCGFTYKKEATGEIINRGFDSAVLDNVMTAKEKEKTIIARLKRRWFQIPEKFDYDRYSKWMLSLYDVSDKVHPCIVPNFDHSPRSKERGVVITNHTPEKWERLCDQVFNLCGSRKEQENIVFIKSWNEWGEGNYLEPDLKFGRGFIDATRKAFDKID